VSFPTCMYCCEAEMEPKSFGLGNPYTVEYVCPKCGATMTQTTRRVHGAASYPPREPFREKILTQQDWRPGPGRRL